MFDLSDYPLDSMESHSKFFDPVNKKVIGKMKDEFQGKVISEFVRLKSKMYSLISVNDKEVSKTLFLTQEIIMVKIHFSITK